MEYMAAMVAATFRGAAAWTVKRHATGESKQKGGTSTPTMLCNDDKGFRRQTDHNNVCMASANGESLYILPDHA